jgi:glutathione S-transferase
MIKLYYHPLSSFCWKALIGLYENGTAFEPVMVNLGDAADREAFYKIWSIGKFPVIRDEARGATVPESTILLDYMDQHYPGPARLIPADPDAALQTRLADRVFDLHLHEHMQGIVGDRLRPADAKDPFGVAQSKAKLAQGYAEVEHMLDGKDWLSGGGFGLAECAALPALYYGDKAVPIEKATHPRLRAYFERLLARPSVQRVLKEAEPYFHMFPSE